MGPFCWLSATSVSPPSPSPIRARRMGSDRCGPSGWHCPPRPPVWRPSQFVNPRRRATFASPQLPPPASSRSQLPFSGRRRMSDLAPVRPVAAAFNAMAGHYDELLDEWYPHILAQIERLIRRRLGAGGRAALAVGCGTGIHSLLLDELGYRVTALDVADKLLSVAAAKASARGAPIDFIHGDARRLPFSDAAFDAIVCVGSTLSLIVDGWPLALAEMARALKPGGLLLLEVEQRWNLDLLWALADSLIGGPLGYEQPLSQSWRNLVSAPRRGIDLSYPLPTGDGTLAELTIHCFTLCELRRSCRRLGLRIKRLWGLHAVTNLLPSTLLHDEHLSRRRRRLARALGRLDARLSGIAPFNRLGCSQVLLARRLTGTDFDGSRLR